MSTLGEKREEKRLSESGGKEREDAAKAMGALHHSEEIASGNEICFWKEEKILRENRHQAIDL